MPEPFSCRAMLTPWAIAMTGLVVLCLPGVTDWFQGAWLPGKNALDPVVIAVTCALLYSRWRQIQGTWPPGRNALDPVVVAVACALLYSRPRQIQGAWPPEKNALETVVTAAACALPYSLLRQMAP